jgi:hypothetical protein
MSTRRQSHQTRVQPPSLDNQDLVAARKRLRPASPAARPTTSHPSGAGHLELQEARGRLRAVSPWVPTEPPPTPRTALIWHPQENFIGPAIVTPVVYSRPPVNRAGPVPVNFADEWTSSVRGSQSPPRNLPNSRPSTKRNFNDIPILHPSRLDINNSKYFSSDFSSSSASSSRPKTSRASSTSSRTSAASSIRTDNRPKTRGGPTIRDAGSGREEAYINYPDYYLLSVPSASRHLSPSRDYDLLARPISRGPSPSRGVSVLYEIPLMSRVASPEYGELK